MSDKQRAQQSHDAAELAGLARSKSRIVQKRVARNPSAPWEVLHDLLATCPGDVVDNPSLPLLLLADPGLFNKLRASAISGLARVYSRLGALLGWTDDPPWSELQRTLICVAAHGEGLPYSDRRPIALSTVREYLAGQRSLASDIQRYLARDPSVAVRRRLALTCTEPTVIEVLLEDPKTHATLARNPNLPVCYLWALASESAAEQGDALTDWRVSTTRIALAQNRNTPLDLLAQLARDPSYNVRMSIAQSRTTPEPLRRQLAWDEHSAVRGSARAPARTR